MRQRTYAGLLAGLMMLGALVLPAVPAEARSSRKEKAWRIGTYVAGAGTIAALATGNDTWALVGGGATLLSYTQWRKEMKGRHKDEAARRAAYRQYRTSWFKKHKGKRMVRVGRR